MGSPSASPAGDDPTDVRIAKSLAHPLRANTLEVLAHRVATPAELALELGVPLSVVGYHMRMLRRYERIELVRTEPARGALQHFYRAAPAPDLDRKTWES